jgi:hypothetical protein
MKIRTCEVALEHTRVDLVYDGILFLGAALHGEGGIMGAGGADTWQDVGPRFRRRAAKREVLRVYTKYRNEPGAKVELFDAPAAECELRAVYAPEYEPRRTR